MPRMNECFIGFWIVHISPPGHINIISFLSPDRARGSKTSPLPCVSSPCCKAQEQPALLFPSGFWALISHSCSGYQNHPISIEYFGRSTAPKLSPTQSDHTASRTPLLVQVLCSLPVHPTLGRFLTSDTFWCHLLQVSACCYTQSY